MVAPNVIDCSRLLCQDVIQTARDIPLVLKDGGGVLWQPLGPLTPLWEPSAYNETEATRVNISFAPTQEVLEELRVFDEWSVDTLSSESARLFVPRGREAALPVSPQSPRKDWRHLLTVQVEPCWSERGGVLGHLPQPALATNPGPTAP